MARWPGPALSRVSRPARVSEQAGAGELLESVGQDVGRDPFLGLRLQFAEVAPVAEHDVGAGHRRCCHRLYGRPVHYGVHDLGRHCVALAGLTPGTATDPVRDRPAGRPRWCRSQLAGSVCHHCRFAFVVSKGVTELVADGRVEPVLE